MNHLTGLSILVVAISLFSSDVKTPGGNPLFFRMLPSLTPSTLRSGHLARRLTAIKDTLVITRTDYSSWENESWIPSRYTIISFNESGSATTINEYSIDDSLTGQTITTFLPDGKTVRTLMINTDYSSIFGGDTMITLSTYYPSYECVAFISTLPYNIGWSVVSVYSLEFSMLSSLDSVESIMLISDSSTDTYDTISYSQATYDQTGENSFSYHTTTHQNYLTGSTIEYQINYTFLFTPTSDTIRTEITMINADPPESGEYVEYMHNMKIIRNKDQNDRVTEVLTQPDSSNSDYELSANRFIPSYSADGTMESVITQ